MRRIDKFRAMSAEELAEMLGYKACRWCSYYDEPNDKCSIDIVTRNLSHCRVGITEGLNQEVNPMPEIKAGDLLFYGKESYYVAITPDKLVTLRGYVVVDLENAIRNDSITTVKRWNDGGFATIWRANNDK